MLYRYLIQSIKKDVIVFNGKPVHTYQEDINNNVVPQTGSYPGELSVQNQSFVDMSLDRCVPEVTIDNESSDWSDIDDTLTASCFYMRTK